MNFLKKMLFILFILLFFYPIFAQNTSIVQILPPTPSCNDSIYVVCLSQFPLGYDEYSVPEFVHYERFHSNSSVHLNTFFDISGFWILNWSFRYDTINIGLFNAGEYLLILSLHTIFEGEPNFYEAADTLSFSIINTIEENSSMNKAITLYPNPADKEMFFKINGDMIVSSVKLYTWNGMLIQEFDPNQKKLSIEDIPSGLYLLNIIIDNKSLFRKVIIN